MVKFESTIWRGATPSKYGRMDRVSSLQMIGCEAAAPSMRHAPNSVGNIHTGSLVPIWNEKSCLKRFSPVLKDVSWANPDGIAKSPIYVVVVRRGQSSGPVDDSSGTRSSWTLSASSLESKGLRITAERSGFFFSSSSFSLKPVQRMTGSC